MEPPVWGQPHFLPPRLCYGSHVSSSHELIVNNSWWSTRFIKYFLIYQTGVSSGNFNHMKVVLNSFWYTISCCSLLFPCVVGCSISGYSPLQLPSLQMPLHFHHSLVFIWNCCQLLRSYVSLFCSELITWNILKKKWFISSIKPLPSWKSDLANAGILGSHQSTSLWKWLCQVVKCEIFETNRHNLSKDGMGK